jgi:inositol phosphorylceramide mannosyltransferase catalytic subunit
MKIPKMIHRIWISAERIPSQYLEYGESWRFYHPDWTCLVWTQHNLPPMINFDEFHDSSNVAQKADILRYEVMHAYGGLYVDMDFECLRPIEALVSTLECFVGEEEPGRIGNALIGCTAGHPFMRRLLHRLPASIKRHASQWPPAQTGPRYFTACARIRGGWDPVITVFSPEIFYALERPGSKRSGADLSKAYAVHHGGGGWHGQLNDNFVPRRR